MPLELGPKPDNFHASSISDPQNLWYVEGPHDGGEYHSGTLRPLSRFYDRDTAVRAGIIAQAAYEEGYRQAQRDFRQLLGMKE